MSGSTTICITTLSINDTMVIDSNKYCHFKFRIFVVLQNVIAAQGILYFIIHISEFLLRHTHTHTHTHTQTQTHAHTHICWRRKIAYFTLFLRSKGFLRVPQLSAQ